VLFDRGTLTKQTPAAIAVAGRGWCELASADAERLGIVSGDEVVVSSAAGSLRVVARVGDVVAPGVVFVPEGFEDAPVNALQRVDESVTFVRVQKA
jgi:anaerobic selenocysteine-containing dehydrogenase